MMQGLSPRGGVRRKHGTNVRVDGKKPNRRQDTQPTFQTRTSRNDEGQSSADSLRQGRLLCISQVPRLYNESRPHRSLGERTPSEFACQIALNGDLPSSQTVGNRSEE